MRKYDAADEERIRVQAQVREWTNAGLLDGEQGAALGAQLRTELRRTNQLVRGALALFSGLMIIASVALVFVTLNLHDEGSAAVIFAFAAVGCFALAEYLAGGFRFYRYGVEEMAAVMAAVFLGLSALLAATSSHSTSKSSETAGLLFAGFGPLAAYLRFGYVYAAIGAMICGAAIPFQLVLTEPVQRLTAAALLGAVFAVTRALHRQHGDDFPGDEYATLQSAAWLGVYLVLNLHAPDIVRGVGITRTSDAWFYWATYIVTWLMPAIGLFLAIRERDRSFLSVNLAIALGTLATNKPYLHKASETWDPILLGLLLMAGAVAVRRWLASAPGGHRNGYTAARILASDRDLISFAGTASAAWQRQREAPPPPAAPPPEFGGGRSGGAGGGAGW